MRSGASRRPPPSSSALAAALVALAACPARGPSGERVPDPIGDGAAAHCPEGARPDRPREGRLRALLEGTERGRALLDRAPARAPVCFRAGQEPAVTEGGEVLLDASAADAESAASLGHLLLHVTEGLPTAPLSDAARPCDEAVDEALRVEARAHALELDLRLAFGARQARRALSVEETYRAAPEERRLGVVLGWLRAGSPGSSGPSLLDAYRARCRVARGQ